MFVGYTIHGMGVIPAGFSDRNGVGSRGRGGNHRRAHLTERSRNAGDGWTTTTAVCVDDEPKTL
eukprot:1194537-Prorocentrum_minimum.AAC.9